MGVLAQQCFNPNCRRRSPGDGPTCRWHVRNYGSEEEPQNVTLCNACKINFDQRKYCPYCVQIYRDKDPDNFDGKEWRGCDTRSCRRWVHVECEETAAGGPLNPREVYICPTCQQNKCATRKRDKRPARSSISPRSSLHFPAAFSSDEGGSRATGAQRADSEEFNEYSKRSPGVDLSKLEASSLKRYKRTFRLVEPPAGKDSERLIPVVEEHFAAQVVQEAETLLSFAHSVKLRAACRTPADDE
ncbi:Putative PHD zinc finger containing protein [Klebsormidium nitens]|uniref:Putative PHD zinc finger containing protein n=1 Tax=Klebsormidium nitens TaxID=105231 RepID=A0A1Y1I5Q0_KLENI|nr:Putative PHD zinc finger containing protein [Klebsormidium nitens]|eukprot:GAQ85282.1 Putative PHD zinc finger containing protein [Klebsormidium nitens]